MLHFPLHTLCHGLELNLLNLVRPSAGPRWHLHRLRRRTSNHVHIRLRLIERPKERKKPPRFRLSSYTLAR